MTDAHTSAAKRTPCASLSWSHWAHTQGGSTFDPPIYNKHIWVPNLPSVWKLLWSPKDQSKEPQI